VCVDVYVCGVCAFCMCNLRVCVWRALPLCVMCVVCVCVIYVQYLCVWFVCE